jgi:hypothetical protein
MTVRHPGSSKEKMIRTDQVVEAQGVKSNLTACHDMQFAEPGMAVRNQSTHRHRIGKSAVTN